MGEPKKEELDQIKYGLSKRDFFNLKGHLHFASAAILIGDEETAIEKIADAIAILDKVFAEGEE